MRLESVYVFVCAQSDEQQVDNPEEHHYATGHYFGSPGTSQLGSDSVVESSEKKNSESNGTQGCEDHDREADVAELQYKRTSSDAHAAPMPRYRLKLPIAPSAESSAMAAARLAKVPGKLVP